jgi:hypothetical protein
MKQTLLAIGYTAVLTILSCSDDRGFVATKSYISRQGETMVAMSRAGDDPDGDSISYVDDRQQLIACDGLLQRSVRIDDIIWSPSGRYFLIESHGEGDQSIDIYEIAAIRNEIGLRRRSSNNELPPYREIDPYCHGLDDIRWVDDDTIVFTSTGNFLKFDRESRRGEYTDPTTGEILDISKSWIWHVAADSFAPGP